MNTVKFLVILPDENNSEQNTTIICEDGGVAGLHHNGEHMVATLYQDRINLDTNINNMWDDLAEGKVYLTDYKGKHTLDSNMISECAEWLFCATEPHFPIYEYVQNPSEGCIEGWLLSNYNK